MVWLKSCPRCGTGDLNLNSDLYGKYLQCLQCGFSKDVVEVSGQVMHRTKAGAPDPEVAAAPVPVAA